jgi:hypothetical protein
MDTSMGEHTEGISGEVGRIDEKENVLGVYPEAYCYVRNDEYLILSKRIILRDRVTQIHILSPHCQSEERAWDCAWRLICTQMMATLAS